LNDRRIAEIWPSRAALDEELTRRAQAQAGGEGGGLLLCPPFYTLDKLLPELLSQAKLPNDSKALKPLAGAMLVQGLLRGSDQDIYAGLAVGRRLPEGLWRLLVEIKAAGLKANDLVKANGGKSARLNALAKLLAEYEEVLKQQGLADQADQLAALETMLAKGDKPVMLEGWDQALCRGVLWLRTLDIRLLRALAGVLPVRVEFALTLGRGGQKSLQRLIKATAGALEAEPQPKYLDITWHDLQHEGGPLKDLIAKHLEPSLSYEGQGADQVELVTAAGRYGLVEALALRALDLVNSSGMPPHQIALVFPDLDVYGPMVADVARRLGLPISFSNGISLGRAPLVQTILTLLELPLVHYERRALADVWASPYLREPLKRMCLDKGDRLPDDVGWVLKRSGYLDSRDVPVEVWLEGAAKREEAKEKGGTGLASQYRSLAKACGKLKAKLGVTLQLNNIKDYCEAIIGLVQVLNPAAPQTGSLRDLGRSCTTGEAVLVRDLTAKSKFTQAIAEISQAASQAGTDHGLTPGRLLALVRDVLNQTKLSSGGGAALGVSVHQLADTMGIKPRAVLVGGLNQGEFPLRPQGQNLLSSADRLSLGKKAKRPVWRTDDEEYQGQVLRLAWLLANCADKAVLGAAGADLSGRQQTPSFILDDLARHLGRQLPPPEGGVFGELPCLAKVRDSSALWGRLTSCLMRPAQDDAPLAQAALWHLTKKPDHSQRWQDLAGRGQIEENRHGLNALGLELRASHADAFSGILTAPGAAELLSNVLKRPEFRQVSPSQLETYAGCAQAWFFSYLLRLKVLSEPGWALEARSEGDWVHHALAGFFKPDEFKPSWNEIEQEKRLIACLEQAKRDLSAGLSAPPVVWQARQEVLLAALKQVVKQEMEQMHGAAPWAVERDTASEDGGLCVKVDEGPPLSLKGRLDRLDQGEGRAVVTDYKHTSNWAGLKDATDKDLAGKTQFQLPVYMAAAQEMMGAGGMALSGRLVPTRLAASKPRQLDYEPGDGFFASDASVRQQMAAQGQPNLFNAIADLWGRLRSGMFMAQPDKKACQYCDFRFTCRAQPPSADNETKAEV
jgi:RecB family exonuclease